MRVSGIPNLRSYSIFTVVRNHSCIGTKFPFSFSWLLAAPSRKVFDIPLWLLLWKWKRDSPPGWKTKHPFSLKRNVSGITKPKICAGWKTLEVYLHPVQWGPQGKPCSLWWHWKKHNNRNGVLLKSSTQPLFNMSTSLLQTVLLKSKIHSKDFAGHDTSSKIFTNR